MWQKSSSFKSRHYLAVEWKNISLSIMKSIILVRSLTYFFANNFLRNVFLQNWLRTEFGLIQVHLAFIAFWLDSCYSLEMTATAFFFFLHYTTIHQLIFGILKSARSSYLNFEYSTSFNPQNSNSVKLWLEKTWKTCIAGAKTWNTLAKVEYDTCSNSTV